MRAAWLFQIAVAGRGAFGSGAPGGEKQTYVRRLNRPGGNVTGVVLISTQATAKRLGLLHEVVPGATRFAMLVNSATAFEPEIADARAAASTIGGQIEVLTAVSIATFLPSI